jgi:regulator of protease activity HflC (stomatin/prohibitin superfamily)
VSGWFITALIFAVITVIAVVTAFMARDEDLRGGAVLVTVAGIVLTALMLIVGSAHTIPTRSVGVVTSFGRPTGSLANGWHWTAPWASVEKFDASVQTLKLDGNDSTPCVTVRLGNQTTGCVDVSVQWNIDPNGDVVDLYRKYKSFDNIEENLVKRQLQHALNVAFGDYDPLRAVNGADKPGASLDDLARKAKDTLQSGVGAGITVSSVTIPLIHFDGDTENRLKAYQQALADTRIAEQKKQTAEQTKAANDILAGSAASKDPGVQYQNCLDLIRELANKGQLDKLPPTFSCGSPSQTPVIVGK